MTPDLVMIDRTVSPVYDYSAATSIHRPNLLPANTTIIPLLGSTRLLQKEDRAAAFALHWSGKKGIVPDGARFCFVASLQ